MKKCEICEKELPELFECKNCGTLFCPDCGDGERNMCEDCVAYENTYTAEDIEVEVDMDEEQMDIL